MSTLTWDKLEDRRFEAGLDRGVLYLSDNTGVAWGGLTNIEENLSEESSDPIYFDGVKRNDRQKFGDYAATLTAYTYPLEFLEYEGETEIADGLYATLQNVKRFGLSYRTLIGDAIEGIDRGYRIHLVYNLTAATSEKVFSSLTNDPDLMEFSWDLNAVPIQIPDFKPTAHLIFDTTLLDPAAVQALEDILYGDDTHPPRLPDWNEIVDIFIPPIPDIITEPITDPM